MSNAVYLANAAEANPGDRIAAQNSDNYSAATPFAYEGYSCADIAQALGAMDDLAAASSLPAGLDNVSIADSRASTAIDDVENGIATRGVEKEILSEKGSSGLAMVTKLNDLDYIAQSTDQGLQYLRQSEQLKATMT